MTGNDLIDELWGYAREVPMEQHPWFQGILQHRWSREQIILGEVQHYLRVRTNPIFFGYMAVNAEPAPGTSAAIEMIIGCCQRRSALEGVAMLAFVESQLGGAGKISEKVYRALTDYYGFSPRAAETYKLHAEEDEGHGSRQIDAIRLLATDDRTQDKVRAAVKLGLTAFTLEWDGHVQAMTGKREFWSGVTHLSLRQPKVRLPEARKR